MERGKRFEDLPAWQAAVKLATRVFELTDSGKFPRQGDLATQLERASLSVSNNIAEGWERGTHEELITFLYYAKGSCGEVRSMLRFLSGLARPEMNADLAEILELALSTSRQLGLWVESAKNGSRKGPRSRNESTRKAQAQELRAAEFHDKLLAIQERACLLSTRPDDSG